MVFHINQNILTALKQKIVVFALLFQIQKSQTKNPYHIMISMIIKLNNY
jgi:hypothetical protein